MTAGSKPFGAIHRRRLYLAESGEDIRGEDAVEAATPQPYTLRFHLHPSVQREPAAGWRGGAAAPAVRRRLAAARRRGASSRWRRASISAAPNRGAASRSC